MRFMIALLVNFVISVGLMVWVWPMFGILGLFSQLIISWLNMINRPVGFWE